MLNLLALGIIWCRFYLLFPFTATLQNEVKHTEDYLVHPVYCSFYFVGRVMVQQVKMETQEVNVHVTTLNMDFHAFKNLLRLKKIRNLFAKKEIVTRYCDNSFC